MWLRKKIYETSLQWWRSTWIQKADICIDSIPTTTLTFNVLLPEMYGVNIKPAKLAKIYPQQKISNIMLLQFTHLVDKRCFVYVDKMAMLMFFGCAFFVFFLNWLECIESHFENRKAQIIHHNDSKARGSSTWGIMFSNNQNQIRLFRILPLPLCLASISLSHSVSIYQFRLSFSFLQLCACR